MSDDPIKDVQALARSHGLDFTDCGNGHVQIKGFGRLVNYWPLSKKRTAFRSDGRKETNCRPHDAIRLCMLQGEPIQPQKKPAKHRPDIKLEPVKTNPARLKHFYSGDLPPWSEELGDFELHPTDSIRMAAYELEKDARAMRISADEIDELEAAA